MTCDWKMAPKGRWVMAALAGAMLWGGVRLAQGEEVNWDGTTGAQSWSPVGGWVGGAEGVADAAVFNVVKRGSGPEVYEEDFVGQSVGGRGVETMGVTKAGGGEAVTIFARVTLGVLPGWPNGARCVCRGSGAVGPWGRSGWPVAGGAVGSEAVGSWVLGGDSTLVVEFGAGVGRGVIAGVGPALEVDLLGTCKLPVGGLLTIFKGGGPARGVVTDDSVVWRMPLNFWLSEQ